MKIKLALSLLLISILAIGNASFGQLSGNVTIDQSQSATLTNFKDWQSFWRSLQGLSRPDNGPATGTGISASLTVDVKSDLTESQMVSFPSISGTGSTSRITIKGHNHLLSFAGPHEVISFSGGDYIKIDSLHIRNTGSSGARNTGIRFYNNSDYNTISNCVIEFSNLTTGAANGSAYIAFAATDTLMNVASSTLTGSYNLILNNTCKTQSGSPGPAYGISICGSTSGYTNTSHNNTVRGNQIENFYKTALLSYYGNGNQFSKNDISRQNSSSVNCNNTLYGLELRYCYGSNRNSMVRGNVIHDLPYVSAPSIGGVTQFYGIYSLRNRGDSARPFVVDSNEISRIAVLNNAQAGYFDDQEYLVIRHNKVNKIETYNNIASIAVWECRNGNELDFSFNSFTNSYLADESSNVFYTDSFSASKTGYITIHNNIIENNRFYLDAYLLLPNNGEFDFHNNRIINNTITGGKSGYLYAIGSQYCRNVKATNNLIANNIGHNGFVALWLQSFLTGNYTAKVWQNTIYSDGDKAPVGKGYDNNGIYLETYYHDSIYMGGNITTLLNSYSGTITGINCSDTADIAYWNNNTYYVVNIGDEYWTSPLGTAYSFANFKGFSTTGAGDNFVNPMFENVGLNKFKSYKWETQNNTPTVSFNPKDFDGNNRNPVYSDRGVYEQYTDLAAIKTSVVIGSTVCSGTTIPADIKIKNNFSDTVRNFYVAWNNGTKTVRQKVTKPLLAGDSVNVVFTENINMDKWGITDVSLFIAAYDDNLKNDSFTFTTQVKPAPGGTKLLPDSKPTQAVYGNGITNDVTVTGEKVFYTMAAPRGFSNSNYNSNWTASAWAVTVPGKTTVTGTSLTAPSGSTDLAISFLNQNKSLEDSVVRVCVKITDKSNTCDTTICRNVFINSLPEVSFTSPSLICGSDTAYFKSTSTVKKGGMRYHWDFGTGNAGDTSDQPEPFFIYSASGTYKVKLTVYAIPNGFYASDSVNLKVSPKPKAVFTRTNACEGETIQFTNSSAPSGLSYLWDFGDGQKSTSASPSHKYNPPGQYTVKLLASTGGCADSSIQKAYTFSKPDVDFTFSPNQCSNSPVSFANKTTCKDGTFASYWDLVNASSTLTNPVHTFRISGTPNVKLVAVSSFGCRDSVTKAVTLKEAPVVTFTHTETCTVDSTVFNNSTPKVPGTSANYYWNFGDGGISYAENAWHYWKNTGPKTVKLKVELSNGCRDSLEEIVVVHTQPVVSFTDNSPVCYGSQVNFTNHTTWASGNINYRWNFGDADTGQIADPSHLYMTNQTKMYNVQLCADVDGYCRTCYMKPVTVNEIPGTCDFVYAPDYAFGYFGVQCIPKNTGTGDIGLQQGVTYKWNFQNNGFNTQDTGRFNFQSDGTYQVTMCAEFGNTGCGCCTTRQVTMSRFGISQNNSAEIRVYPNPNQGAFMVQLPFESAWNLTLFNTVGQIVHQSVYNTSMIDFNVPKLAAGLYLLKAESSKKSFTAQIQIRD